MSKCKSKKYQNKDTQQNKPFQKTKKRKNTVWCKTRMDRYRILFCKTTSLIPPRWREHFIPLYSLCFVRACDG